MRPQHGEYMADSREGITRMEDLPLPLRSVRSRNYRRRPCPRCQHSCYRNAKGQRSLHDLGCLDRDRPRIVLVVYSRHYCTCCQRSFSVDMSDLAPPGSHYTQRVICLAVRLVVEDGLPYRTACWHLWRDHRVFVPFATIQNWVEAAGKKSEQQAEGKYLDCALADFSGYLAVDELYDGPFCVLSAVDPVRQRRLLYEVLDHNPSHADILLFLARVYDHIRKRQQTLVGITTDASPLYPEPIRLALGPIRHQICKFHIIKELVKEVLRIVAAWRNNLRGQKPTLPRGRPAKSKKSQRLRQQALALQTRITDLFEHRHLFIRHHLEAQERELLKRITRFDRKLRVLRAIMDEVYRLFDRRCTIHTALAKSTKLRKRVRWHKILHKIMGKLNSPNLAKALTFLDDKLLSSTSNAVERGNRRVRKMQKTVYRVRTQTTLQGRLALDLQREGQASGRHDTLASLHHERNGH